MIALLVEIAVKAIIAVMVNNMVAIDFNPLWPWARSLLKRMLR